MMGMGAVGTETGMMSEMAYKKDWAKNHLPTQKPASIYRHLQILQAFNWQSLKCGADSFGDVCVPYLIVSATYSFVNIASYFLQDGSISNWKHKGKFSFGLFHAEKLLFSLVPLVILLMTLWRRNYQKRAIDGLVHVQNELGLAQAKMPRSSLFILSTVLVANVNSIVFLEFAKNNPPDEIVGFVFYNLMLLNMTAWVLQFTYFVQKIESCMTTLADVAVTRQGHLTRFVVIYNKIINISENVGIYHNVITTFTIIGSFLHALMATTIAGSGQIEGTWELICTSFWALQPIILLGYMLGVCHMASDKADVCNGLLVDYIIKHKMTLGDNEQFRVLVHLSAKKTVVYRAMKCLPLNFNLGVSMFAAYVTYIVVLVQLDNSVPEDN